MNYNNNLPLGGNRKRNHLPYGWIERIVGDIALVNANNLKKDSICRYIEYIDIDSVEEGIIKNIKYIKLDEAPSRARRILKDKDILISSVRPNLKHYCRIKKPKLCTVASTGFIVLTPKDIDSDFLYYSVTTNEYTNYLSAIAETSTTAYPSVTADIVAGSTILCPLINEQKAIAKILSDLDSKIELNQKMNKTLEAIAQAIFKHWFVDFEFTNEEGKPYKSSGGEMVDSELGEIPKGWEFKKLGDLIYLEKGLSYKGRFLSTSGNPLINLGCISPKDGFIKEGVKYYNGEFSRRHTVRVMDIVIANTDITQKREILGSPIIIPCNIDTTASIIFTHHLYAVRFLDSVDSVNKEFVYHLMKSRSYGDYVKSYATGTTVLAIPKESVLNFNFAYPSESLIELFSNLSKAILYKIQNNQNANDLLSTIRESLLPKLITGKIRVPLEE